MKKAKYITLEGGDGAGKSTLFYNLSKELKKTYSVLETKEFGSLHDNLCKDLRPLAISTEYDTDELAGQIIFAAIIRQHHEKVIKKNLDKVDIILSDRGIDSNYAYAPSHGIDEETFNALFKIAYKDAIKPDITFYLDVEPSLTEKRRAGREKENFKSFEDRIEKKGSDLQKKIRENFLKLAEKEARISVIKITEDKTPEMVLNEVMAILKTKGII